MSNKLKFIKDLASGILSYNIISHFRTLKPKKMQIVVTYQCNSRCIMCNIWKNKPGSELSLTAWKDVLKDPIFTDIEKVNITGGEAFLKPDIIPFINLLIEALPKINYIDMVSNGFSTDIIVQSTREIINICNRHSIRFALSISLDGVGSKHDDVRQIPLAYEKAMRTVMALQELQKTHPFTLGIGSVIMSTTLSEVDRLIDLSSQHKIPHHFQIVSFHDSYVDNIDTKHSIGFTEKDLESLLHICEKFGKPKGWSDLLSYFWKDQYFMRKYGLPRSTPCPFLLDEFAIDAAGNVYYCLGGGSIGNIKESPGSKPVSTLYFSPQNLIRRKRMKTELCPACSSICNARKAIAYDFKKFVWFKLTGTPWHGIKYHARRLIRFKT